MSNNTLQKINNFKQKTLPNNEIIKRKNRKILTQHYFFFCHLLCA